MMRVGAILLSCVALAGCGPSTKRLPTPQPVPSPQPQPTTTIAKPPAPPTPAIPWQRSGLDWSKLPAPGAAPAFRIPAPTEFRLRNKLRVVVIENRKLPVISMQLINRHAGTIYEKANRAGLAALTADLLDEGAGRFDTMGLAKQLERLGASMGISSGEQDVTIGLTTLASTLDDSLRLLRAVASKPRLHGADFKRVKGDRLSAIRRRRDSPRRVAGLLYSAVLWGSHPYGRPIGGTAKTLSKLRLAHVRASYRSHYAPRFMTLVVAGDVDAKTLRKRLEKTLGRWRKRMAKPRLAKFPKPTATPPRLVVSHKADAAQSVVRIGRIGISRRDPHYFSATVINAALGGSFAARLNQRLREALGYTYGARSSFWYGKKTGSWTARTALKTTNTIDGIREALRLIESVRAKPLPAAELARTKNLLARSLPQKFEGNSSLVSVFSELLEHGLRLDWYSGYARSIQAVTAEQAGSFATANWARDKLAIVVVGDLKKILPGLLRLGLGDALELDPEGNVVKTHRAESTSK